MKKIIKYYFVFILLFQLSLDPCLASDVVGGEVRKTSAVALNKDQFSQIVVEMQSGEGKLDFIKITKDLRSVQRNYQTLRSEIDQDIAQMLANKIIKLVEANQHNPNMQCMILTYSNKIDHPSLEEYYQKNKNHTHGGVRKCVEVNLEYMHSDEVKKMKPFQVVKLPDDFSPVIPPDKGNKKTEPSLEKGKKVDAKKANISLEKGDNVIQRANHNPSQATHFAGIHPLFFTAGGLLLVVLGFYMGKCFFRKRSF